MMLDVKKRNEPYLNKKEPSTILAEAFAKVLVGAAFLCGIGIVIALCFALMDARPYRCWHRYWW